jgi:hypothetical protein
MGSGYSSARSGAVKGRSSSLTPFLLLAAVACAAPPAPLAEVFVEGETCRDHDFTVVGREAAFAPCYSGAILQLQTTKAAPPGGYHATWRVNVPAAGWWEVLVAATRPEASGQMLSPWSIQVGECRPRDLAGAAVTQRYGPNGIFGWVAAGRYRLSAGEAALTIRCDRRRVDDQAYLCYVDALALRRIAEPAAQALWLAPGDHRASFELARLPLQPRLWVVCDGRCEATVNGVAVGRGEGTGRWTSVALAGRLRRGTNALRVVADGPVLVRLTELHAGGQRTLLASGRGLAGRVLGPDTMAPYGDWGELPMAELTVGSTPIPFKTGNLSVDLLMAVARGKPRPEPKPHPEFDDWLRRCNITTVEDYLCWLPLEPERDRWQWEFHERNAAELEARGMRYAVYPWIHFPPAWALASELWEPLRHLGTGQATYAPSIWSPRTLALFDRFYRQMHARLGDRVKEIFVAMVTDYGEIGYPIGMADWVVPAPYKGPGFWCGDERARADFRARMLARYGGLAGLNTRWGTAFATGAEVTWPACVATEGPAFGATAALPPAQRAQARRAWLDFVEWYIGAMVDFAGQATAISRRYYPRTPHEIKIGFGNERVMHGADYSQYVARSRTDGYVVRSTHGKLPLYFYRRFSTPAKHYGVRLVTEPPSQVTRDEEVERLYKDAISGTSEFFDYPANFLGATDLFARYAWYLEGHHSLTEIAWLHPTTDHRLRPGQGNPRHLVDACAASCELFDWDLLDERLVRDGALDRYRVLLLPEGNVFEADVLARLRSWVAAGGTLIAADRGPLETVEGDRAPAAGLFVAPADLPRADQLLPARATPLPAWRLALGNGQDEPLLTGDWSSAESGHWEWGGAANSVTKRWSGGRSGVWLPVEPGAEYELAIAVAVHPKRAGDRREVLVNGAKVGELASARTSVFRARLGPAVWRGRSPSELVLSVDTWQPSVVDGSSDARRLGVAVAWVKLWRVGQPEPEATPLPRVWHELDLAQAQRCTRRVGAGATVLLPADLRSATAWTDAVAGLLHGRLPWLDGRREGVWTALLPNRVLLYNSTSEPRPKTITLEPDFLARLGAAAPTRRLQAVVDLPPRSLASVELPSGEVVLP